jgi:hypothetical protein
MPARWCRWAADSRRADRSERLRRYWDRQASPTTSYDRQIAFFERVLFGDGRSDRHGLA